MAHLTFNDVRIAGLAASVPTNVARNADLTDLIPPCDIAKTIDSIGISERRFVSGDTCASDLCFAAATRLLDEAQVDRGTIDLLIFATQLPDHPVPATAPSLQHRLGLPETCASFDLSLGCSSYIYALATAYAYASQPSIRRVLLLDGETFTKVVSPRDKVNAPLYGDAGTATLIEKGTNGPAHFSLFSNGAGASAISVPAGAGRMPASAETLKAKMDEDGNVRSGHELFMDGMEVFNFTIKVVPKSVLELLRLASVDLSAVDYLVFHQANKFMTDFFAKKIKCPKDKIPYSMNRFGNVSSASIPLTIVSELRECLGQRKRLVLSGFGAGLSWAAALIDLDGCVIPPVVEV